MALAARFLEIHVMDDFLLIDKYADMVIDSNDFLCEPLIRLR
jgi:hypothetical protein